jgi:hypothetical protein
VIYIKITLIYFHENSKLNLPSMAEVGVGPPLVMIGDGSCSAAQTLRLEQVGMGRKWSKPITHLFFGKIWPSP